MSFIRLHYFYFSASIMYSLSRKNLYYPAKRKSLYGLNRQKPNIYGNILAFGIFAKFKFYFVLNL